MSTVATPRDRPVSLIVQRVRSARILLNEKEWRTVGGDATVGMLVYVSFASHCDPAAVEKAATTLLNLPILTSGVWGDGSETESLLDAASKQGTTALLIVPQANLISKVKQNGRSIQYHGQVDRETGQKLFETLVDHLRALILQHQAKMRQSTLPAWFAPWKASLLSQPTAAMDPSLSPADVFRHDPRYSAWNDEGLPTHDAEGQPLTKSALKKAIKFRTTHTKKHEKWLSQQSQESTEATSASVPSLARPTDDMWNDALDATFCDVVYGSYGKRQGLELSSDMGPFCHAFSVG